MYPKNPKVHTRLICAMSTPVFLREASQGRRTGRLNWPDRQEDRSSYLARQTGGQVVLLGQTDRRTGRLNLPDRQEDRSSYLAR